MTHFGCLWSVVTLSGETTLIFVFASHLLKGQLLKKKNCSARSKFLPIREDPTLKGLYCPGEQIISPRSCFSM